jgi:hypothetical protein
MTYTGGVGVSGSGDTSKLPGLTVTKGVAAPMDNLPAV